MLFLIAASTLSPVRVLHPIAACPFSAKIGYAPFGASTLSPVRVLYPFAACPFLAKIGYAPFGASTLSPVRVLYPFAACPFSAKIGYAPFGASTLSPVRVLHLSQHNHSWPRLGILHSEKAFCRPSECNKGVPSRERLLARPFSNIITGTCADYLIITFLPSTMYIPLSSD